MFMNKSVDTHQFSMIPRADIPRSKFDRQCTHKTTFDAGYLIPVFIDEVLPGDTFNLNMTAFARLSTPLFPIMDNMYLDSFFFFVPNRLVWSHWVNFMGEQANPTDSTSYSIPQVVSVAGGYATNSIFDYMGLPTVNQVTAGLTVSHSALPLRCYNLIWNTWFRDENLQNSVAQDIGDGPDLYTDYALLRRGKRKDYFTSALPWPQKGTSVSLPLGTTAPVYGNGYVLGLTDGTTNFGLSTQGSVQLVGDTSGYNHLQAATGSTHTAFTGANAYIGVSSKPGVSGLYADLSSATAATINQLRQSFQIQKLLERDARGGTRYTEIVRSHFGVVSPDARLQRPEYLGGGSTRINVSPIAQTSGTGASGTTAPVGTLAGMATALSPRNGFTQSFTEHGHVIGMVSVRADLTYQQGMRRMWSRSTRYDFYFPAFAMLGEQGITNDEIYVTGNTTQDDSIFGYQARWDEYRYFPSMISGAFRSTASTPIDGWHLAQKFSALPTLSDPFIQDTPPVSRVVAVGSAANGQQFIFDSLFDIRTVRAMPMYSVPGLIDHF